MKITIGTQDFILHPSGIMLWPKCDMAIVSDLHLEKGSHFAARGFFIPPYDTHATLQRLLDVCAEHNVKNLMLLGDCFHDAKGYARLDEQARADFHRLLDFNPVWIKGNHDYSFVPPGFTAYDTYEQDSITFRHIAEPGATNEITGHYHPKIRIAHKGAEIKRACFIEDGSKMILPAFGSYTGGLFVDDPVISNLFSPAVRCHAIGERKIFSFKVSL